VPVVAFEVLSATASHAARKPAAHADREGSTPFADMLDTPANKPAARHPAKDTGKNTTKNAAAPQQPAPGKAKDGKAPATEAKAKAPETPDTTDVAATAPADGTTTDTTSNDRDTTDGFLTAVADATGVPVAPADAAKTDAKSDDASVESDSDTKSDKADGKGDDSVAAATDTTVPVTAEMKTAPVAAVVTAPAQPAADAAPADTTPAAALLTVAVAGQGIAKVAAKPDAVAADVQADTKSDGKTEQKADKPPVVPKGVSKLDTPPLFTQAAADNAKQAANPPQSAQPQQAQAQNLKTAADASAQPDKTTSAHHDTPAPDVISTAKPADATQPLPLLQANGPTVPQTAAQTPATPAPATAPQAVALPIQGIAVEIAGKALAGKNRFDIRLDPPELGKIHVRLDVDHKGEVTSIITADRSDTFDLLRRDAQSLERALQDAGVRTSSNGLQFSLRDQGQQNMPTPFTDSARVIVRDDALDTEITAPVYRSLSGNRAGLDIRV
jgi:flagellar hook-length control protein FliK